MSLPKFTPHMLSYQPDQTAYLLNKLAEGHGGGGGTLYDTTGQHTDGAMTQKATTNALGTKADAVAVGNALAGKVDKEVGKGLSTNDFTDADESKLNGIQAGAEVNVQADWDQTDADADDYIKNKPTIPSGQIQSDWTQSNTSSVDYIKNKPTNLMTTDTAQTVTGTKTFHNAEIATDNIITLNNNTTSLIRGMSGIEYRQLLKRGSTDVEVGNAHDPLALKGSGTRPKYNSNDLALYSDVPAAQVQSDWDQADNTAVDYIKNKPNIPSPYTLPPATTSTLGGVIVGSNLTVAADGTLSATGGTLPSNLVYHDTPGTVTPVIPYVSFSDLIWSGIFDKIYPVGSIFMSATLSTPADVATALGGGTWVAWGAGRVPVGVDTSDTAFDTVEETGGSKTHRHTMTNAYTSSYQNQNGNAYTNGGTVSSQTVYTGYDSTLQPYITCYMYKRTA